MVSRVRGFPVLRSCSLPRKALVGVGCTRVLHGFPSSSTMQLVSARGVTVLDNRKESDGGRETRGTRPQLSCLA